MSEEKLQILHVDQDLVVNYLIKVILPLNRIPFAMDYASTTPDAIKRLENTDEGVRKLPYDVVLLGDVSSEAETQLQNVDAILKRVNDLRLTPWVIGVAKEPIQHPLIKTTVPRGKYKDLVPVLRRLKQRS